MTKVSATEAAKLAGKSIPTITRAIKSGALAAEKQKPRGYLIDVSELDRVYDLKAPVTNNITNKLEHETPNDTKALEVEVELLREMLEKTEADRDDWKAQAQKAQDITALITHQQDTPAQPSTGFFGRVKAVFTV